MPETLAASTGFLLSKAAQRGVELVHAALAPLGVKSRHYGVLAALAEAGPLSQHVLSEQLRIDRTTMVAVVDDLERLGLAARRPDPTDRRAHQVQLTASGAGTLAQAGELIRAAEDRFLALLSPAERRQLHALLRRLGDLADA